MSDTAGLYIHIPFCRRKCGYCDFYSLPADDETRARYVRLVCAMLEHSPFGRRRFSSLYLGGGTPPLVGAQGIATILDAAGRFHDWEPGAEVTLECNPEGVTAAFFTEVAAAGVNRVSIGLQSAHDTQLSFLGREHTRADAAQAVRHARRAGIENISLDLMLALPGQTPESLGETLTFCRALEPTHISAYLLKIEENTRFARENAAALCPGEEEEVQLYLQTVDTLGGWGLAQYEISNFARSGFESVHNTGYWLLRDYLGIGPAAHGLMNGERFHFERSLSTLLHAPDPWALRHADGRGGDLCEYMMLRLRLCEGLDTLRTQRLYPDFDAVQCLRRAQPLCEGGLLRITEGRIALTPRGFLLSNSIIAMLIPDS